MLDILLFSGDFFHFPCSSLLKMKAISLSNFNLLAHENVQIWVKYLNKYVNTYLTFPYKAVTTGQRKKGGFIANLARFYGAPL